MGFLGEAALVFTAGAAVCLVIGRLAIPALERWSTPARYQDCPPLQEYQEGKRKTPTMGGLFVLLAGLGVAAAAGGLSVPAGWLLFAAVAALAAVGLLDDVLKFRGENALGIRSGPKLLVALAVGAGIGWGSRQASFVEVPWLARSVDLGIGWIPFAALVVAGCAHAVNLTDGMDGLAAGCVAIALVTLALLGGVHGAVSRTTAVWCIALAGALAGFLWFNCYPASIYLGDVGALGLGTALGTISLLNHTALWLPIVGGVFVIEALSVMLQVGSYKFRNKRRIFRVAPIHHHFHLGGITEPKLILRFWLTSLGLAMLALTSRLAH